MAPGNNWAPQRLRFIPSCSCCISNIRDFSFCLVGAESHIDKKQVAVALYIEHDKRDKSPSSVAWACDPSGGIKVVEHGYSPEGRARRGDPLACPFQAKR
ncbi:unnamed protein product [Dovyalis caffra]|uniref:Uncharacterized protein n=1 Tax=Dovyalis caffra TaxID=77055 RepID=A0AAV1RAB3_9ROSI|nr:unnamed protein product [Dovyalis caffra]